MDADFSGWTKSQQPLRLERREGHLRKNAIATIDPLQELIRVVNEAQERDAEDERRLYHPMRESASMSFRRRPN